jgi:uncharacterized integral membrane protein
MSSQQQSEKSSSWKGRLIVAGIIGILLLWFILANLDTVEVRMFFMSTETSLAWALLISAALGFLVGILLPRLMNRR